MENKKNYFTPEVEVIDFSIEDVITTSTTYTCDPDGILDGDAADSWVF